MHLVPTICPRGDDLSPFLRRANLSSKGCSGISELLENERDCSECKTLLETKLKSCSKYLKFLKSCRATCGKSYLGLWLPFWKGHTKKIKNKQTNKRKEKKHCVHLVESRSAKASSSTNKLFLFSEKRQKIFCHVSLLNEVSNHPLSYRIWTLTTYFTSPC